MQLTDPPKGVKDLAEIVGRKKAFQIAGIYARDRYAYIPKHPRPGHPLVDLIGMEDATSLSKEFPGMMIYVSSCRQMVKRFRDRAIVDAVLHSGLTYQQIGDLFEVHADTVKNAMRNDRYGGSN